VTCSACHYQFAVPQEFAGKKGKCPKCGAIITAPTSEFPAAPAAKAAPPARLKTAAPLESAAAPAPARPAPRQATVQSSNTVRATDTVTTSSPEFNFNTAPASPSATATKPRGSKPKPAANNTGMYMALGAGGGVLGIGLIIVGLVMAFSGGSETPKKPIADAGDSTKAATTKGTGKKKKKPAEGDGSSLLDRPEPKPDRPKTSVPIVAAKPHQAKTLEEIKQGVVKIESPGINGMSLGTGFLVNEKGWVATNCHVIDDATDQTRVVINKQPYKVAGLVIKAPEHDMAIIKLAEQPFQLTVLDISYNQNPKFGSKVWAIGYPSNVFNLTDGIVSNVCTMNELDSRSQKAFLREAKSDPTHLWIQHSAKISPGNSGGPLLNEENQVIGINTWGSGEIDTGYAGHINHLRDLLAKANDTVTPFPKGMSMEIADSDEFYNIVPTAARVNQLVTYCTKFGWKPSTKDEFEGMAELAKLITFVQVAPGAEADLKKATDAACQTLKGLSWDAEHAKKINGFAQDATGQALHGVIFVATLTEPNAKLTDKVKADRMTLEGVAQSVICRTKDSKSLGAKDTRMLVVGINIGIIQAEGQEPQRVILPGYSMDLKK
jgi:hypothetical protein